MAIHRNPDFGNIGPATTKQVMKGKAVLFKHFTDIDVFDIKLASDKPEAVIRACQILESTFDSINLEDIRAPECFEIEEAFRRALRIPIFHDDQRDTAIIAGAAPLNGLEIADKDVAHARIVINGVPAQSRHKTHRQSRMERNPTNAPSTVSNDTWREA